MIDLSPLQALSVCRGDFKKYPYAGVSEWQTRQTQNLLAERACGFESHRRHFLKDPHKHRIFVLKTGIYAGLRCLFQHIRKEENTWTSILRLLKV